MHKFIDKIKSFEEKPFVINNFVDEDEIKIFQSLYDKLPIEINNTRQKIIKKKWAEDFYIDLQKKYIEKLSSFLKDFKMDNPETKDSKKSLGLFQESFLPVSLHVDAGFDFEKIIGLQNTLNFIMEKILIKKYIKNIYLMKK